MGNRAAPQLGALSIKNSSGLLTLALLIGCLNYGLTSIVTIYGTPAVITFNNPSFAWAVAATKGSTYLANPATYTGWTISGGVFAFTGFTYSGVTLSQFGFSAETLSESMTLTGMTASDIVYSVSGASTQKIWLPTKGNPTSVTGGIHTWNEPTKMLTVTTLGPSAVVLHWGITPPALAPIDSVQTLWRAGDFLGGVTTIYTTVLGPAFYGIMVLLVMLPLYFRTQSIVLPLGVAILLSGLIEIAMPAPALDFARFITIAGVACGLFLLVTRGRS